MTEIEVPLEKVHADLRQSIHESLPSDQANEGTEVNDVTEATEVTETGAQFENKNANTLKMMMAGALLSAGLAVFAAICALMAGHNANEAMLLQIQSSDQWNFFQAKSIKANLAEIQLSLLQRDEKQDLVLSAELSEKISTYKQEQEQFKIQAESKQKESTIFSHRHEKLAMAVTFFQVAIALTAISVIVKKGKLMYFSGFLGLLGLGWFAYGLLYT